MDYHEIISRLEKEKLNLVERLENKNLREEEYFSIQHSIDNYNYILELTIMNHFERGTIIK